MTGTKNRNLPFGPHIYGQFMIYMHMEFSVDGAFMVDWLVRYVVQTLIVSILPMVGSLATLIVIDVGYNLDTSLDGRRISFENITS